MSVSLLHRFPTSGVQECFHGRQGLPAAWTYKVVFPISRFSFYYSWSQWSPARGQGKHDFNKQTPSSEVFIILRWNIFIPWLISA